jgi:NADH-quinone oxidoreductase subunit C
MSEKTNLLKEKTLAKLRQKFSDSILAAEEFAGDLLITIPRNSLLAISQFLRDDGELRFDSLRDVLAIDQYRPQDRFEVVYNIYSVPNRFRVFLKIRVDESDLKVPTLIPIWPAADWMEREVYDMHGIKFEGHQDLRRIYMPDEFEYHPLRKEFPLMGIPGSLQLPRK